MTKINLKHAEAAGMADFFPRINIFLEEVTAEVKAVATLSSKSVVANVWQELAVVNDVLLKYAPAPATEAVKLMTDEEAEELGREMAVFTVLYRNFLAMQEAVAEVLQQHKGGNDA
ncbi:hypothetical protein [Mannheimia indoligenes]|uniref:hypothetical protein n=1 Tax=Mannheimia indoligenes TaxID=3103145 RepID=UPI002FE6B8E8